MDKIIKVNFEEWQDIVYVDEGLVAWNYGEILQVEGLALPDGNIEVHFSFTDREGDANVYIGTVKDNVLTVGIPDFIFQKEDVYQPTYDAYAFIYQTDGDSGRTIKKITFTIKARPEPTTDVPEDKKDPFLDEVRQIMTETKEIAQSVRDDADAGKFGGGTNITVDAELSEESENPVQNKVITAEVIALRERNAELEETIEKLQIKVTTEPSPYHHITDSANMKVVDFGMSGITEQDTVPGNQLFDLANSKGFVSLYSGLSTEIDLENNTLTTTNTHTTDRTGYLDLGILPAGTYYLSFEDVNNYSELITVSYGELETSLTRITSVKNIGGSFTIEEELHCWLIKSIHIDNPLKLKNIMLNKGDTALPVEKYVGGMPSPNPEHEEEITLAGVYNEETGRYEHKCCVGNKNLLDESTIEAYSNNGYVYCKNNEMLFKAGQTYTFKTYGYSNLPNGMYVYVNGKDVKGSYGVDSLTFTFDEDTYGYLRIYFVASNVPAIDNIHSTLMVNSKETDYTPHASQPFTITSDRPLTKWDNLVKRDGVWGWSVNNIDYTLTGNESMGGFDVNSEGKATIEVTSIMGLKAQYNQPTVYCNCFYPVQGRQMYTQTFEQNYACGSRMNNRVTFGSLSATGIFESKDTFINFLKNNKVRIVGEAVSEQSFHPLPDEEQTLLNNLETYYGVTNVYNEQGCPMWLTYISDPKLYVDQKLLQIQQAII